MRTIRASIRAIAAIVPRDNKSGVPAEYCVVFALIGLFIGAWVLAVCCHGQAFSAGAVSAGANVAANNSTSDRAFSEERYRVRDLPGIERVAGQTDRDSKIFETKWPLNDLARHLAISVESTRLLYKDEPDTLRLSALLRKKSAPYCVPDSVARRVYRRYGGVDSYFNDEHFTIRGVAAALGCGHETARLLVRRETGVLKIRLGKKRSHSLYSIPKSVLLQLHTRLLNAS
jgi:hypothetical protein